MPPDILLNHLISWVYSLDQQKFKWKAFQSHKQSLVKTLKHVFASCPVLRNKLTKKLISLERSLDSATQESCNPLNTIHPLLLKVCDGQNWKMNQTAGSNDLESLWETGIDKLKQDFVAMFSSSSSSSSEQTSQHSDSNITIESIEKRLYNHRRMLDAIEPLENIIVHMAKQLRRSMETNKEVIFNCVQISKELNLHCNFDDSMNLKQSLPLTQSSPLMRDFNSPTQQTQSQPTSLTTSSAFQTSVPVPHLSSPQEVPSTCFSNFLVVPFLSRLVRTYSRVVALITDDQLGPRVIFNTDSEGRFLFCSP